MNSPPPRGEYLLLISNLVVCSTIYSHHYGLLCIYFLLWVLIHYYIICCSNRSTLALVMFAAWLLDPLTCFVILRLSFFFCYHRFLQAPLFSLPWCSGPVSPWLSLSVLDSRLVGFPVVSALRSSRKL